MAVLEGVAAQPERKTRKKVYADLEVVVVVHHDVNVGATVVGNEDGHGSWDEEHMSDPSQSLGPALELLVLVKCRRLFPSVTL